MHGRLNSIEIANHLSNQGGGLPSNIALPSAILANEWKLDY